MIDIFIHNIKNVINVDINEKFLRLNVIRKSFLLRKYFHTKIKLSKTKTKKINAKVQNDVQNDDQIQKSIKKQKKRLQQRTQN